MNKTEMHHKGTKDTKDHRSFVFFVSFVVIFRLRELVEGRGAPMSTESLVGSDAPSRTIGAVASPCRCYRGHTGNLAGRRGSDYRQQYGRRDIYRTRRAEPQAGRFGTASATTRSMCRRRHSYGVLAANTPDAPTESTAEQAVGLLLAVAKAIVKSDRVLRANTPCDACGFARR